MVGLGGLEPPTSPLSGARSSHLSYRPFKTAWRTAHNHFILQCLSVRCNCHKIPLSVQERNFPNSLASGTTFQPHIGQVGDSNALRAVLASGNGNGQAGKMVDRYSRAVATSHLYSKRTYRVMGAVLVITVIVPALQALRRILEANNSTLLHKTNVRRRRTAFG
jgi:hypothetical protein